MQCPSPTLCIQEAAGAQQCAQPGEEKATDWGSEHLGPDEDLGPSLPAPLKNQRLWSAFSLYTANFLRSATKLTNKLCFES